MSTDSNTHAPLVFDAATAGPLIGQSKRWMNDNARAGIIPAHKIGRKLMFTHEDLQRILDICAVGPDSAPSDVDLPSSGSSMTKTTARRLQGSR